MSGQILIARDIATARRAAARYRARGTEIAEIATPRSLDRLRGVVATGAILCGGVGIGDPEMSARIEAALAPCLATARQARSNADTTKEGN